MTLVGDTRVSKSTITEKTPAYSTIRASYSLGHLNS